ncbi:hypothetical protein [Desmonostoc muscorum]|uniref:Uncharacterized protein n=1 Tax=Desmonostoc muscorum LEGE 12446 TaxID=1828758 RepID=A0A8J6ZV06_DESMC|nr:hypothetical protein [Desmonostoc muscorum]
MTLLTTGTAFSTRGFYQRGASRIQDCDPLTATRLRLQCNHRISDRLQPMRSYNKPAMSKSSLKDWFYQLCWEYS